MPTFNFKCSECGLKFEVFTRDNDKTSHTCKDCGSEASKCAVTSFGFRFEGGETAEKTGVDSLDSNIDKIIGRDSKRRWEAIKDRRSQKRKVQRKNGEDTPLRKDPETGKYKPMEDEEVSRFQTMHAEYADMYEEHKKKREEKGISKFKEDDPYSRKKKEKAQKKGKDTD